MRKNDRKWPKQQRAKGQGLIKKIGRTYKYYLTRFVRPYRECNGAQAS